MAFFPGLSKASVSTYSDTRSAGKERDPTLQHQPELAWYMDKYPEWRSLYNGTALEETVPTSSDPGSRTTGDTLRYPCKFNLISSYCQLHAGMLWGRGRTGSDSSDLFNIRVDPNVPGRSKPATEQAPKLADILQHFWSQQAHVLRPSGVIQQWAGGCVLKPWWNPTSPSAVYGIDLQIIQPEHFFPIWNPLSFEELIAVKIKFNVSKAVAIASYGLTDREVEGYNDTDRVPVEEYWDRRQYWIKLCKQDKDDPGVVARNLYTGEKYTGQNPLFSPRTNQGVIPFVYVPRLRVGGFLGDSTAYHLTGLQGEVNKTLADYGDALTRGTHPAFGLSDYTGPGRKQSVLSIPRHGALNLGQTSPGSTAPKVHQFPLPQVPPQTGEFTDRLLALSEVMAGLTPAARGASEGAKSALAIALEMLPTTNLVEWERSHWSQCIAGRGGINDILLATWHAYAKSTIGSPPAVDVAMFPLRQYIEFRPVVPRDRLDVIDEVVRLATAGAVSPSEWLRRLGDVDDIDAELEELIAYWAFKASKEAAVAGRAIKVSTPTNPKSAARAYPEVSGETVDPAPKQPAKQAEGLSGR